MSEQKDVKTHRRRGSSIKENYYKDELEEDIFHKYHIWEKELLSLVIQIVKLVREEQFTPTEDRLYPQIKNLLELLYEPLFNINEEDLKQGLKRAVPYVLNSFSSASSGTILDVKNVIQSFTSIIRAMRVAASRFVDLDGRDRLISSTENTCQQLNEFLRVSNLLQENMENIPLQKAYKREASTMKGTIITLIKILKEENTNNIKYIKEGHTLGNTSKNVVVLGACRIKGKFKLYKDQKMTYVYEESIKPKHLNIAKPTKRKNLGLSPRKDNNAKIDNRNQALILKQKETIKALQTQVKNQQQDILSSRFENEILEQENTRLRENYEIVHKQVHYLLKKWNDVVNPSVESEDSNLTLDKSEVVDVTHTFRDLEIGFNVHELNIDF